MNVNRWLFRAVTTGLFAAALSIAAPIHASDASGSPSAAAARADVLAHLDIFNFGQISSSYYRGGELKGRDAADLAKLGIKTIIDLRSDDDYDPAESQLVTSAGMAYVRISMTTHVEPTGDQVATFLSLVNDPARQPVYVHCVEGRHRTGVMTAVYRMAVDGWTADRAFQEMKQYKFGADFLHPQFKSFVYSYHPAPFAPAAAQVASGPRATQ